MSDKPEIRESENIYDDTYGAWFRPTGEIRIAKRLEYYLDDEDGEVYLAVVSSKQAVKIVVKVPPGF